MKIQLGFSPCPNDTFIFDALVNGKIDTGDLQFEAVLEDVQTLNDWSNDAQLDVTKLSFPALFQNLDKYVILNSGAALGKGVGPLLIAKREISVSDASNSRVAIPGEQTTANFLLSFAFPELKNKIPMVFNEIEKAVLNEHVTFGVIIHENRFTYAEKGLVKICDLGAVWEQKQSVPIPLGCIAVSRRMPAEVQQRVDQLIRKSLQYAYDHLPQLPSYVVAHAQEMNEKVVRQHIDLYVNKYSLDLGINGRAAIEKLYEVYCQLNDVTASTEQLFLNPSLE